MVLNRVKHFFSSKKRTVRLYLIQKQNLYWNLKYNKIDKYKPMLNTFCFTDLVIDKQLKCAKMLTLHKPFSFIISLDAYSFAD